MKHDQPLPAIEFTRPLEVGRLPKLGSHENLVATPEECSALAKRLQIPALHTLSAALFAKSWRGGGVKVTGELKADLDRISVASLEVFRTPVRFEIERYYLNVVEDSALSESEDIDPILNGVIDLGELVSETLALEMDPYPRKPDEAFAENAVDVAPKEPEKHNPFMGLNDKLKK